MLPEPVAPPPPGAQVQPGEGRGALIFALASLAVCLAGAGTYLGLHSSGAVREAAVLARNVDVAQKVLLSQSSLQGYLATGGSDYLKTFRFAAGAFATAADELKAACAAIEVPPEATAQHSVESLVGAFTEWQAGYAEPAIRLKAGGTRGSKEQRSATSKLAALRRKGIGADSDREVANSLDTLNNGLRESALPRFRGRIAVRKRFALLAVVLGLAGFLGAGWLFLRQRQALLDYLRRRSARLQELAQYADRLHLLASTDQAAKLLAAGVGRHAARAAVLLADPDGSGLHIAASAGDLPAASRAAPVLTDTGACPVLRTGHRFVVHDPAQVPPCDCAIGASREDGYACLPLLAQGRTAGLVTWTAVRGSSLGTADVDRVEELGRVTSLALTTFVSLEGAKHEAVTDQLTGVSNRRFLDGYLARQFLAAVRTERPLGVLMLDLDRFKSFNDANGHPAGDALLRAAAKTAAACVREGDLVARYGGEEFAVVLPEAGRAEALEIAERIREAIEAMRVDGLPSLKSPVVTVSIGLAVAPGDGRTVQALVRAADEALYRAKEQGRNRIVTASEAPPA
ncbi:MAG: sensor domain-containing diguanylate cyclase [Candidatus Coatesbacteria bacterium]